MNSASIVKNKSLNSNSRHDLVRGALLIAPLVILLTGCGARTNRILAPITQGGARMEVQHGRQQLSSQNYDSAASAFARAVKLDPQNANAHYGLGQIAARNKEYDAAAEHFRSAVKYDPGNFDYAIALADFLRDNLTESSDESALNSTLRAYDYAHHLDPQRPEPLIALAMCQRLFGEYDQASKAIDEALLINPSSIPAHNEKAAISQARGEYRAALEEYRIALEINPNDIEAHNGSGEVYAVLARTSGTRGSMNRKQALTHFRRSLQIDQSQPRIREMLDALALYEYRGVTVSQKGNP
jgi:Tfp pilus assembly protein PilF